MRQERVILFQIYCSTYAQIITSPYNALIKLLVAKIKWCIFFVTRCIYLDLSHQVPTAAAALCNVVIYHNLTLVISQFIVHVTAMQNLNIKLR